MIKEKEAGEMLCVKCGNNILTRNCSKDNRCAEYVGYMRAWEKAGYIKKTRLEGTKEWVERIIKRFAEKAIKEDNEWFAGYSQGVKDTSRSYEIAIKEIQEEK